MSVTRHQEKVQLSQGKPTNFKNQLPSYKHISVFFIALISSLYTTILEFTASVCKHEIVEINKFVILNQLVQEMSCDQ